MRDLVRGEIERQQTPSALQAALNNTWVLILLLILVVSGGVWGLVRNGQARQQRLSSGDEGVPSPADKEWLQKPPQRRGKLPKIDRESERILDQIRVDWERGDYDAAERKLSALSILLEQDAEAEALRTIVAAWNDALRDIRGGLPDRREFITRALAKADALQSIDAVAAKNQVESVIELYASDRSVSDLIEQARRHPALTAKNEE